MLDHAGDQRAGGGRRLGVGLGGEMALEDGFRRALAELGLEDRRERETTTGAPAPDQLFVRAIPP